MDSNNVAWQSKCKDEEKDQEKQRSLAERLFETRTVLVAEQISKELAETVTGQLLLMDESDDSAPINLYINSPGGDVDAGFAIFDMVRFISAPVRCISVGLTASAAVVILLSAGKKNRFSLPNSRFLMHQPSTGVRGTTSDIKIEATEIVKMREKINRLIALETGQSPEKVEKDTTRNYWIGAEEALNYGLISKVISTKSDIA